MVTSWDLSRALELVKPVYGLMRGIPTDKPLESTYWRKQSPIPSNGPGPRRLWASLVRTRSTHDGGPRARSYKIACEVLLQTRF